MPHLFKEEFFMSLTINNNMMAYTSARYLSSSYNKLSDSTRKLSSGLRVDTAADDAAGLAIRELMRSDIAALNQGVRNANDGISLIQTADGALSVIDEKLIRMKELAEQAATGTYDSTQRLLIDSEYQQMASEITRIANATDFNGIKLLDGTLSGTHSGSGLKSTGALKIHFGTANDSAEDYYYIKIGNATASSLGVGNAAWRRKHHIDPGAGPKGSGGPAERHCVQGQHPCPFGRHAKSFGKHHQQPSNPGGKSAGRRIAHFRRGRRLGNDQFRQEPDSYPVGRGHAFAGQFPAATGLESAVILPRQPVRRSGFDPEYSLTLHSKRQQEAPALPRGGFFMRSATTSATFCRIRSDGHGQGAGTGAAWTSASLPLWCSRYLDVW